MVCPWFWVVHVLCVCVCPFFVDCLDAVGGRKKGHRSPHSRRKKAAAAADEQVVLILEEVRAYRLSAFLGRRCSSFFDDFFFKAKAGRSTISSKLIRCMLGVIGAVCVLDLCCVACSRVLCIRVCSLMRVLVFHPCWFFRVWVFVSFGCVFVSVFCDVCYACVHA